MTQTQTRPANTLAPLFDSIKHLLYIKDGKIQTNTLPSGVELSESTPKDALHANFVSDDPIVQNNQTSHDYALTLTFEAGYANDEPIMVMIDGTGHDFTINITYTIPSGTQADVHEYLHSASDHTLDFLSQSFVGSGSTFKLSGIANLSEASISSIQRLVRSEASSHTEVRTAQMGDGRTKQSVDMDLLGVSAYGEVRTVAIASHTQEVVIDTHVEHKARETEGYIEHYGVAAGESFLAFEGTGKIHKGMKKSIAHQSNNGVVLGETARLDANPLLLIDEYDVEASHGAAIGRIDEEQLYYLMSRGLSEADAQRLIIHGFLAPLKTMMQNDTLREHIETLLANKTGR